MKNRKALRLVGNAGLTTFSIVLTLMCFETGLRLSRDTALLWSWPNLVLESRIEPTTDRERRFVHDSRLGYAPQPGFTSEDINYDSHGFRVTPGAAGGMPILAVGDSFTHGDEVSDDETWPTYLQEKTGRRTVNAGVSAYGIDQAVLRAEILARTVRPGMIVLSFIADDLRRAEMKRTWGVEKPYFELHGDSLALRNTPVPHAPKARDTLTFWHRALGWSVLADEVVNRLGLWDRWGTDNVRVLAPGTGERLACPMMRRLSQIGVPTLVIAQYDSSVWEEKQERIDQRRQTALVLKCAASAGLATLDTFDIIGGMIEDGADELYEDDGHMSAEGNQLVASAIVDELRRRGIALDR